MDLNAAEFRQIVESLRKVIVVLRDLDVRYALAGSVASWARGGPETVNDLDLIVAREDAERAFEALKEARSEEHTSQLQSRQYLVCRLLLEKKKKQHIFYKNTLT